MTVRNMTRSETVVWPPAAEIRLEILRLAEMRRRATGSAVRPIWIERWSAALEGHFLLDAAAASLGIVLMWLLGWWLDGVLLAAPFAIWGLGLSSRSAAKRIMKAGYDVTEMMTLFERGEI